MTVSQSKWSAATVVALVVLALLYMVGHSGSQMVFGSLFACFAVVTFVSATAHSGVIPLWKAVVAILLAAAGVFLIIFGGAFTADGPIGAIGRILLAALGLVPLIAGIAWAWHNGFVSQLFGGLLDGIIGISVAFIVLSTLNVVGLGSGLYEWAGLTGLWPIFGNLVFSLALLALLAAAIRAIIGRSFAGPIGVFFRAMPLTAAFGLTVILLYIIGAVFAPLIAPYGESEIFDAINQLPGQDPRFSLGTDQLGRDLLTRLIYGGRNTIGIALITVILAFVLGASLGFLAAVLGGWLDQVLSRIVDALMAIPQLIFALLLITIFGQSTLNMILVIAVLDSTRVFRLSRAVGVNIVVMDYIEAAKLRGENLSYLIFKEILPNATAPLLAEFGLRFCFVFLLIASLSFLGIGIQPPLADWGTMVRELAPFINYAVAPGFELAAALPLMPAAAIALLTVAVNFVVDWMLQRYSGLKE